MLSSYPKVYALGHPLIRELLDGPVVVQEKVDGSQFSFGVIDGELRFRSKGTEIQPNTTDGLFGKPVQYVTSVADQLREGYIYRGEALCRPKHNTLQYGRAPQEGFILFDVEIGPSCFLTPAEILVEADLLDVEVTPRLDVDITSMNAITEALKTESFLGGALIEGIVIKNYERFGIDGKILAGKYVSEAFKESHSKAWRTENPTQGDLLAKLIDEYQQPARWAKSVQHLREAGALEGTPRDIGALINECKRDLAEEIKPEVMEKLWRYYADKIIRGATHGLPEWYKAELAKQQFDEEVA